MLGLHQRQRGALGGGVEGLVAGGVVGVQQRMAGGRRAGRLDPAHAALGLHLAPGDAEVGQVLPHIAAAVRHGLVHVHRGALHRVAGLGHGIGAAAGTWLGVGGRGVVIAAATGGQGHRRQAGQDKAASLEHGRLLVVVSHRTSRRPITHRQKSAAKEQLGRAIAPPRAPACARVHLSVQLVTHRPKPLSARGKTPAWRCAPASPGACATSYGAGGSAPPGKPCGQYVAGHRPLPPLYDN